MVRSAERRIEKYKHNVDGEAVGRAIKALKEIMVDQQRSYFPQISLLEMKVKKVVEAAGIPVQQVAQYINVARKCYHVAKTFSQATRDAEAQNIVDLWTNRGLNAALVSQVCGLTGCKPAAGAAPVTWLPLVNEMRKLHYYHTLGLAHALGLSDFWWDGDITGQLFPLTRRAHFDRICIQNGFAGNPAHGLRAGLYETDGYTYPTNLIAQTAVFAHNQTGLLCTDIDVTLEAGTYYLGWISSGDTGKYDYTLYALMILGSPTGRVSYSGWGHEWAGFPNLPDPFPTTDPWLENYIYSICMRFTDWA